MIDLETPNDFQVNKSSPNISIVYKNIIEISQGGPRVGELLINGHPLKGLFGGPLFTHLDCIYIPQLVRRFVGSYFRLAKIDVNAMEITLIGSSEPLIWLKRIEGDTVYFYDSIDQANLRTFKINNGY